MNVESYKNNVCDAWSAFSVNIYILFVSNFYFFFSFFISFFVLLLFYASLLLAWWLLWISSETTNYIYLFCFVKWVDIFFSFILFGCRRHRCYRSSIKIRLKNLKSFLITLTFKKLFFYTFRFNYESFASICEFTFTFNVSKHLFWWMRIITSHEKI